MSGDRGATSPQPKIPTLRTLYLRAPRRPFAAPVHTWLTTAAADRREVGDYATPTRAAGRGRGPIYQAGRRLTEKPLHRETSNRSEGVQPLDHFGQGHHLDVVAQGVGLPHRCHHHRLLGADVVQCAPEAPTGLGRR